jgi:hypothetical protein
VRVRAAITCNIIATAYEWIIIPKMPILLRDDDDEGCACAQLDTRGTISNLNSVISEEQSSFTSPPQRSLSEISSQFCLNESLAKIFYQRRKKSH